MDTSKIIVDLKAERDRLDQAIAAIQALDNSVLKSEPPKAVATSFPYGANQPRVRRTMSLAARKKIAAAQRKRWAAQKKATPAKEAASAKKATPARHMSAATRKRLSELAKKRWAERKKAAKTA